MSGSLVSAYERICFSSIQVDSLPQLLRKEMKTDDYSVMDFSLHDIRNVYEKKVVRQMRESIKDFSEFDNCRGCLSDVYALALSRIPATYSQYEDVVIDGCLSDRELKEIVNYAIYQVAKNPKHKKDRK